MVRLAASTNSNCAYPHHKHLAGAVGYYNATKVYAALGDGGGGGSGGGELRAGGGGIDAAGIIPNARSADSLAKQARMDTSTLGRSLFRKRLQSRRTKSLTTNVDDDGIYDSQMPPAYERVVLRQIAFKRPVVLYGPLADVARQLLLANFSPYFDAIGDDEATTAGAPIRLDAVTRVIDANKHCLLNITRRWRTAASSSLIQHKKQCRMLAASSVERLQLAQFAPIVILIEVSRRAAGCRSAIIVSVCRSTPAIAYESCAPKRAHRPRPRVVCSIKVQSSKNCTRTFSPVSGAHQK